MTTYTLKNLDAELIAALRERAERDRRSLNQEIIHLLQLALRGDPSPPKDMLRDGEPLATPAALRAQVEAWRKLAGKWQSDVDAKSEARAMSSRRRSRTRKVDL